jgi:hypothetical protein
MNAKTKKIASAVVVTLGTLWVLKNTSIGATIAEKLGV